MPNQYHGHHGRGGHLLRLHDPQMRRKSRLKQKRMKTPKKEFLSPTRVSSFLVHRTNSGVLLLLLLLVLMMAFLSLLILLLLWFFFVVVVTASCIFFNSHLLFLLPLPPDRKFFHTMCNYRIPASIFTVEIIIKGISYGLLFHDGAFMRSGFNLLDILVFCPFISSLMPSLLSTFFVFSVYSDRYLPSTRHKVRDGTMTMTAIMMKQL